MNDDGARETKVIMSQTFSKFSSGSSFALIIVSVILNIIAIVFQRFRRSSTKVCVVHTYDGFLRVYTFIGFLDMDHWGSYRLIYRDKI